LSVAVKNLLCLTKVVKLYVCYIMGLKWLKFRYNKIPWMKVKKKIGWWSIFSIILSTMYIYGCDANEILNYILVLILWISLCLCKHFSHTWMLIFPLNKELYYIIFYCPHF